MASKSRKIQPYTEDFLEWYWHYPRKVAKLKAAESYDKAVEFLVVAEGLVEQEARDRLLESVKIFAVSYTGKGQFCPHPATWLNQARYDDDPREWNQRNSEPTPEPLDIAGALERTRKDGDDGAIEK